MPVGRSLGIKSTKTKAPVPNKTLELAYANNSKLHHKNVRLFISISLSNTFTRQLISKLKFFIKKQYNEFYCIQNVFIV